MRRRRRGARRRRLRQRAIEAVHVGRVLDDGVLEMPAAAVSSIRSHGTSSSGEPDGFRPPRGLYTRRRAPDGGRPLRIGLIAPPFYEIPPRGYGGTEAICHSLAVGLVALGHDVTLIAAGADHTAAASSRRSPRRRERTPRPRRRWRSSTPPGGGGARSDRRGRRPRSHPRRGAHQHRAHRPDAGHGPRCRRRARLRGGAVGRARRRVHLVAISDAHRAGPDLNWVARIYNGIPVGDYRSAARRRTSRCFRPDRPAPRASCPRSRPRVPRARLVLAGSGASLPSRPTSRARSGRYSGRTCSGSARSTGTSRRTSSREPPACSSPSSGGAVRARDGRGHGMRHPGRRRCAPAPFPSRRRRRDGVVCDRPEALPQGIEAAVRLSPQRCRERVEARFSMERMVQDYERCYRGLAHGGLSARPSHPSSSAHCAPTVHAWTRVPWG